MMAENPAEGNLGNAMRYTIVMRINLFTILGFAGVALGALGFSYVANIFGTSSAVAWFIICWSVGSVFIGWGMRSDAKRAREDGKEDKQAAIASLKSNGKKIMTEFKAMDRRWTLQLNDQPPAVVYTQDAQGHTYESENLWFQGGDAAMYNDPAFIAWQKLQAIDPEKKYFIPVYVNPNNLQEYYMDLAALEIKDR